MIFPFLISNYSCVYLFFIHLIVCMWVKTVCMLVVWRSMLLYCVQVTLRRTWGKMPLWHKTKLLYSLFFQAVFLPSPEDLNRMVRLHGVDCLWLDCLLHGVLICVLCPAKGNGWCGHVDSCDSRDEQGVPHSIGDACQWTRSVSILLLFVVLDIAASNQYLLL